MPTQTEKLAVFMYLDADDRQLEKNICKNLMQTIGVLTTDDIEVYVYLDRLGQDTRSDEGEDPGFDDIYTEWLKNDKIRGGSLYGKAVRQSDDTWRIQWDTTGGLVERDSSLASSLDDFLKWATPQTDAGHYIVLMSDHGSGMQGGFSDSAIKENNMLPAQYGAVLKQYSEKLDVIVFDACLMANAEGLSALSGVARYAVASEELVDGAGLDYAEMFRSLAELETADALTIAETIVRANTSTTTYKTVSGATTLASLSLDDRLSAALQEFGRVSADFTDDDWSALIDAFHNEHYYYRDTYADLAELMTDPVLIEKASQNLKTAAAALVATVADVVTSRKTGDEHGYGVTVYSPIRKEEYPDDSFGFLSQLPVGNDSPWADFLYRLYQKAKAEDKVHRELPQDTVTNTYSPAAILLPMESGPFLCVDAKPFALTGNGLVHEANYNVNQENWLCFRFDESYFLQGDTYSLNFTFSPALNTKTIEAGDIVIRLYAAAQSEDSATLDLAADPFAVYENEAGSSAISIAAENLQDGKYALQIFSEKAVSYTFEGDHRRAGEALAALEDRFDLPLFVDEGDPVGNHEPEDAQSLKENYCGALAVTADTEKEFHSDWFCFNSEKVPDSVTVTAIGTSDGAALAADDLTVLLWEKNEQGQYISRATASGVLTPAGTVVYSFSDKVEFTEDDCLSVSTGLTGAACYYEISLAKEDGGNDRSDDDYPWGFIDVTSVAAIPGKDGSFALNWTKGHNTDEEDEDNIKYQLQLSPDNFQTMFDIVSDKAAVKIYNLNQGVSCDWRVRTLLDNPDDDPEQNNVAPDQNSNDPAKNDDPPWTVSPVPLAGTGSDSPRLVIARNDFLDDYLMGRADGTWSAGYQAKHVGFSGGWTGTGETAALKGKNKITDVFKGGGEDMSVLVLTDDGNGDAVFADDIYSAKPEGWTEGRLSNLSRVFAGAGNDVVDFTSQRFGAGSVQQMSLYGGSGDDVLWTADTATWLFGDEGNDRLAGSTMDDVFVGGFGSDSMFAGGGNDVFCFCENWGCDTIDQISGGTVILWFEQEYGQWDAGAMTYTAGENTIVVRGIEADAVDICIGEGTRKEFYDQLKNDSAFAGFASQSIFS